MLINKADEIEDHILKMLSDNRKGYVDLKRTDIADLVSCAPSQISYVLSTRFTNERGYSVESRRGLGGYVRITVVNEDSLTKKNRLHEEILNAINDDNSFFDVKGMLDLLLSNRIITVREAELVAQTAIGLYKLEENKMIEPKARTSVLRKVFNTLSNIT